MCLLKHHTPDSRVRASIAAAVNLNLEPFGGVPRPLRPDVPASSKRSSRSMLVSVFVWCVLYDIACYRTRCRPRNKQRCDVVMMTSF